MIRHLGKFNSVEAIQAAIETGALASPYVAYNVSSNVVNLVLPEGDIPATINYSREGDEKVRLTGPMTIEGYYAEGSFLNAKLNIPLIFDSYSNYTPAVRVVDRSWFDLEVNQEGLTEEEFILACFNPNTIEEATTPQRFDYASWNYLSAVPSNFSFGQSVTWKSGRGFNDSIINPLRTSGNDLPVPSEDVSLNLGGNDRQGYYTVLAAYIDPATGVPVEAFKLGNYKIDVYLTDDSSLVNSTMPNTKYAYEYRYSGGELTTELDYTFYILQNSVYDKARLVMYWAEDYNTPEAAMTGSGEYARIYDVDNFVQSGSYRNFGFTSKFDSEGWPLNNSGTTDLHARFALQLYNSVTEAESSVYGYSGPTVEGEDEPVPVDAWWEEVDFSEVENIIEPDGDFHDDMTSSVDGINTGIVAAIANSGDVVLIINGTYEDGYISGGRAVIGTVEPGVGDWEGNDYLEFADCSIGDGDTVYILGRYEDREDTVYFLSGEATSTYRVDTVIVDSGGSLDSIYGPSTPLNNPATAWYENVDFSNSSSCNDSCEILYESGVSVQNQIEHGAVDLNNLFDNASDAPVTLVVNGEYDGAGHLTGGRRIPGVIDDVNSTITFTDVYASEYDSLTLVIDMAEAGEGNPVDASVEYVYHNYKLIRQDEVGAFIGTKYQITQSVDSQTGNTSYAVSYVTTASNVNRWSNFYADDQSGTMMFGNNFGISREDIDTRTFEAPQLQVAHFFKNEYDAVSDSSTFIFNEFLNSHSENIAIDLTAEGDVNSTPFEYDSSEDEVPVTYWTRVTDASTDNATEWQDMGSFPDINVGYGNEHIDSDSSVLYISSSPSNDALAFGYTEARFGVWNNADYDASVTEGGMDETEFFIANMTLGPVNVENGYDASFNIKEGHSEFIGQCYNPTTQEYWGNINHMYGFDFPIPFEFKTTFNDQTYVVDASAILSAGHINDGWTQYKYGWYDRSAWENDENGIQEQYDWDENAYRMANVQGTNSYSTTTFTCTADNSKSYKFSVFAIPYRLDGDGNDEHDWEYFRVATYDINM